MDVHPIDELLVSQQIKPFFVLLIIHDGWFLRYPAFRVEEKIHLSVQVDHSRSWLGFYVPVICQFCTTDNFYISLCGLCSFCTFSIIVIALADCNRFGFIFESFFPLNFSTGFV